MVHYENLEYQTVIVRECAELQAGLTLDSWP